MNKPIADLWSMTQMLVEEAVLAEREACAQLCEEWLGPTKDREIHIAAAIRARGEQA